MHVKTVTEDLINWWDVTTFGRALCDYRMIKMSFGLRCVPYGKNAEVWMLRLRCLRCAPYGRCKHTQTVQRGEAMLSLFCIILEILELIGVSNAQCPSATWSPGAMLGMSGCLALMPDKTDPTPWGYSNYVCRTMDPRSKMVSFKSTAQFVQFKTVARTMEQLLYAQIHVAGASEK
uniref:Uncharacterized protein n=1 Tax=Romanomermis culicivorax TaxID=13658 RepID=A0A915K6N6_ROMCU